MINHLKSRAVEVKASPAARTGRVEDKFIPFPDLHQDHSFKGGVPGPRENGAPRTNPHRLKGDDQKKHWSRPTGDILNIIDSGLRKVPTEFYPEAA